MSEKASDIRDTATEMAKEIWTQQAVEEMRAVISMGQSALKSAMLVNGGAAIALLGFLATVWSSGKVDDVSIFASAMFVFVLGVLSACVALGFAYAAQHFYAQSSYAEDEMRRLWSSIGRLFHVATSVLLVVSYVLFTYGGWLGYSGFS
jgi:hypothetical protein